MKLNLVELSNAANLFPNELSGGMRKRAALARALALDPQLLFADEPSAGLDPVTSRSLDELFLNLRERLRTTMVIVTHELASIYRIADRIAFLHQGRLLFTGTVAQALKSRIPEISQFFSSGSLPDN
jgi:phospholipid/cholesterol/gamma-HCH transport system ATP-binding protein